MNFLFAEGQRLVGEAIDLVVERQVPADPAKGWLPAYQLAIVLTGQSMPIGRINVRPGYTELLERYAGHLGYEVDPASRGRRFAAKACLLARQILEAHNMNIVWITCRPGNLASMRTCELIGSEYVDTVDLPPESEMYRRGERRKHRYRWVF